MSGVLEGSVMTLYPNPNVEESAGEINFAISVATIECHFWMNEMFLGWRRLIGY